jgi:3-hydroxypropanoate dehydrogenase
MVVSQAAIDSLFLNARTANGYKDQHVGDDLLKQAYEIACMGPTSMNTQPARFVFLRTPEQKERLMPALLPGNVDKTRSAPVTVIVASDSRFYEHLQTTWHVPDAAKMFENNEALAASTATRNSTLTGAYFIIACRALGLDCGPMSGFDPAKVNQEFFPDGRFQVNFLLNLGYADRSKEFPRNPRLSFEQACQLL